LAVYTRLIDLGDFGADRQRRAVAAHHGDDLVAGGGGHDQAVCAKDFLYRQHLAGEFYDAVAGRRLGLQEHRRFLGAVRQRDAVAVLPLGDEQLQRIGHQFKGLRAPAGIEHRRVPNQRGDGAGGVEIVEVLAAPAYRFPADRAQRRAVLRCQVVEPRVLLVQPLHRDRAAVGPAVAAFRGLLGDRHVLVVGIQEPDQPFGLARGLGGVAAGVLAAEQGVEALQRPFPGLSGLDDPGESQAGGRGEPGFVGGGIGRHFGQDFGIDAGDQRQRVAKLLEAAGEVGALSM